MKNWGIKIKYLDDHGDDDWGSQWWKSGNRNIWNNLLIPPDNPFGPLGDVGFCSGDIDSCL